MTPEIMRLGRELITPNEITGKRVLEIGSYNVNGSYATFLKPYNPLKYIGIDIQPCDHFNEGQWVVTDIKSLAVHLQEPCVNLILNVHKLLDEFGKESFDFVICTEMLEHVEDWKNAISIIKNLVKPNGYVVLTTRCPGFALHGWPDDWWRFTHEDIRTIFSDFNIIALKPDIELGVFIKAQKPINFTENVLDIKVFSMK
jgi:SAM-dependent methyltransferase